MKKTLLIGASSSAALVLLLALALPFIVHTNALRPQFESYLGSQLGRPVHIGNLSTSLMAGGLRADEVVVADKSAYNSGSFVEARSISVGVNWASLLLSHSLRVSSLTLVRPRVTLVRSAGGRWNFSDLGANGGGGSDHAAAAGSDLPGLVLERLRIVNGTFVVRNGSRQEEFQKIEIDAHNVSFTSAIAFSAKAGMPGGGEVLLNGEAGPVDRADAAGTPFQATLTVSGAHLDPAAGPGPGGVLSLSASMASNGRELNVEGNGHADKLRLLSAGRAARQPVQFRFSSRYFLAGNAGVVRSAMLSTGNSAASLSGTYAVRNGAPNVRLKLQGSRLVLTDIQAILPALGITLPAGSALEGGRVDANLNLDGPVDRLVTSGTLQMSNAHLKGYDLGAKLASVPALGRAATGPDLFIASLASRFRIAPEGTHISGFKANISRLGDLSGEGTIDSSSRLHVRMVARIAGNGMVRMALDRVGLKRFPNQILFLVEGTTSNPSFRPDAAGTARALLAMPTSAAPQGDSAGRVKGFFRKLFGRKHSRRA